MEAARISTVICQLCKATVRANSLTKLQLHLETRHDVLHNQDLVMALSFLEVQEMEVIIDQVIPRMKNMLDEGQSPSTVDPEEKLETVTETLVETSNLVDDEEKCEEDQETLTWPNVEITKMTDVPVEEKKKKGSTVPDTKLLKCSICEELVKKYKFSQHRRNCKIIQKDKQLKLEDTRRKTKVSENINGVSFSYSLNKKQRASRS